jgi:hypothetical protein
MGLKGLKTFIANGFCGSSMNIHSSLLTPGICRHEQKKKKNHKTVQSVYMQSETIVEKLVTRVSSSKYVVQFLTNLCSHCLIQEGDCSSSEGSSMFSKGSSDIFSESYIPVRYRNHAGNIHTFEMNIKLSNPCNGLPYPKTLS